VGSIDVNNLLPLFVAIPLGLGFVMTLLNRLRNERVLDVLAVLGSLSLLVLTAPLFGNGSGTSIYWTGHWTPALNPPVIGICLVSDGLSRLMLLVVNLVSLLAVIFSTDYMKRYTSRGFYYALFFLMVAGMNGVVLTGDFFNLYVFLEVAGISSYALVAFGCESAELEASFKYLVLGSLSALLVFVSVAILYGVTGTLNMAQVAQVLGNDPPAAAYLALGLLIAGFGLKGAMVPFHAWLPDAHPSAPAPISAMLSGVLIKASGVYVLFRIIFNIFAPTVPVAQVLIVLGALSMVVGVFLAVGQWDFKRLLAYHSISQMGYVVLAVGVGAEVIADKGPLATAGLAIFGGLFHLFNHAAFKSLLFLTSGAMEYATGTRQLKELGGLSKLMPVTSGCCRVAALSIAGVPPFNGFWSKLVIVIAVIQAGHYWLGALTVLVSFMTLLSFVKVQRYALAGEPSARTRTATEVPFGMVAAMIVLAALCLLGGVFCPYFKETVFDPARDVLLNIPDYVSKFGLPVPR
jgi:multicomponent Na+:H+ antiporter subunit D